MSTQRITEYYGTKRIHAWLQIKDDKPGYGVSYEDGYISWSPKAVFEKAYQPLTSLSFGHAVEVLKAGGKVTRPPFVEEGAWIELSADDDGPRFIIRTKAAVRNRNWVPFPSAILANDWTVVE